MKRTIVIFGSLAAVLFILFELNKLSIWRSHAYEDIFVIFSGLAFIGIGLLMNWFWNRGGEIPVRKDLGDGQLTKQEHLVLLLMSDGLSNREIAQKLFIAESTVKTHVSHILSKLNARRRTEAVKIGRDLDLV